MSAHINTDHNKNDLKNYCSIIALKPKQELFTKLTDISKERYNIAPSDLNPLLNNECLETHTVPVCIPLFTSPADFYQFIKTNSVALCDFMLSAWPFSIEEWGYTNKSIELLERMVDIKYFALVCKAIEKPVSSSLDLAVTFATPTKELVDYIVERASSKKMVLSEQELNELDFMISTGVAIITNKLEQTHDKDLLQFYRSINDSKNYLAPLNDKIVTTLFHFYFKNINDFPEQSGNSYLNQWFTTKTYLGLFMLVDQGL